VVGGEQRERPRPSYELKADHEKVSAYFNLDNGTGKIRGIYLQGNEAVRPIFRAWLAPFADMGATTITSSNTGGTDHQSFDGVGIPGFQFIQDALEYDTRTHHSSMDVYERIQEDDAKQASIIMATFVYLTAMRDEKLPRKPLDGEKTMVPSAVAPSVPRSGSEFTCQYPSELQRRPLQDRNCKQIPIKDSSCKFRPLAPTMEPRSPWVLLFFIAGVQYATMVLSHPGKRGSRAYRLWTIARIDSRGRSQERHTYSQG